VLSGDERDGVIETALTAHWEQVFIGKESWNQPNYFFPYRDTLGYNDGYLLNGILFHIMRLTGLPLFLAREGGFALERAIGFLGFWWLTRHVMGMRPIAAIFGATLFTVSNSLVIQAGHAQLLDLILAPWLIGALIRSAYQDPSKLQAYCWAGAAAAVYGLWLMSGFYMAWFAFYFGLIMSGVMAAVLIVNGKTKQVWRQVRYWSGHKVFLLFTTLVMFLISAIPFLIVYLPKLHESGGHMYTDVVQYLGPWYEGVDTGAGNLFYGGLIGRLGLDGEISETTCGTTPGVWLLAIVGMLCLAGSYRLIGVAAFCAVILAGLSSIHIGTYSLWHVVFRWIPGAHGLRTVSRMWLFLIFPLVMLASVAVDRVDKGRKGFAIGALALFAILEQVNTSRTQFLEHARLEAMLSGSGSPAAFCRAFFVLDQPPPAPDRLYDYYHGHTQAMLLSEITGLPTISGFSTFNPPDWDFRAPYGPAYLIKVAAYAVRHQLIGKLCGFDLQAHKWLENSFESGLPPTARFALPFDPDAWPKDLPLALISGWSGQEPGGRWTDGRDAQLLLLLRQSASGYHINLNAVPFDPGKYRQSISISWDSLDGRTYLLNKESLSPGRQKLKITVPAEATTSDKFAVLHLHFDAPISPDSAGVSHDRRKLGVFVSSIEVKEM